MDPGGGAQVVGFGVFTIQTIQTILLAPRAIVSKQLDSAFLTLELPDIKVKLSSVVDFWVECLPYQSNLLKPQVRPVFHWLQTEGCFPSLLSPLLAESQPSG